MTSKSILSVMAKQGVSDAANPQGPKGPSQAGRASVPNVGIFATEQKKQVGTVLHVPDGAPPYDPSRPSMCVIRTANSGLNVGSVSGSNLPEAQGLNDSKTFVADAVTELVERGFTLASTTTDKPPELIFTLMREGETVSQAAQNRPPTGGSHHAEVQPAPPELDSASTPAQPAPSELDSASKPVRRRKVARPKVADPPLDVPVDV